MGAGAPTGRNEGGEASRGREREEGGRTRGGGSTALRSPCAPGCVPRGSQPAGQGSSPSIYGSCFLPDALTNLLGQPKTRGKEGPEPWRRSLGTDPPHTHTRTHSSQQACTRLTCMCTEQPVSQAHAGSHTHVHTCKAMDIAC